MHPRLLVLDEPTSALDPTAAEDVLGVLARLVDDLGLTVLVAEHRMERVVPFADRLVVVERGGCAVERRPSCSRTRRSRRPSSSSDGSPGGGRCRSRCARPAPAPACWPAGRPAGCSPREPAGPGCEATGVGVRYGRAVALRDVDLGVAPARWSR